LRMLKMAQRIHLPFEVAAMDVQKTRELVAP
jgi:hypothetical protein